MNILKSIGKALTGDLVTGIKDLVTQYLPPDMSPKEKADMTFALEQLATKHASDMEAHMNERLRLELGDVADARLRHTNSAMPAVVTVMLTIMMSVLSYGLFFSGVTIDTSVRDLALTLLGTVCTVWIASIQYWVGTTRSSQNKDYLIHTNTK